MSNTHPNIIFCGTPWIASKCLETLLSMPVNIVAVICQPDNKHARNNNLVYCDVKQLALKHELNIIQANKINDEYQLLKTLNCDLLVTCAYGQFISDEILALPKYKAINIHTSLLPNLRGGAPIHWAIINQFEETGVTFQYMVKKMDAGPILWKQKIKIDSKDTYNSLQIKLATLAQQMLDDNLMKLFNNSISVEYQDESKVSFAPNITKQQEIVNFNLKLEEVDAWIRGLYANPTARFIYEGENYKIHECQISNLRSNTSPGTINAINQQGIFISTKTNDIILTVIQASGKKPVSIKSMINGHHKFIMNGVLNKENG